MKQTISVLVENQAGVLNRITGLFSRRAFNIESLAVGVTDDPTISRITIIVDSGNSVVEQVEKYFGNKVYETTIPRSIRVSEAPGYGQPINFYEPKGKGSEAYMDLAIEFVKRNNPAGGVQRTRRKTRLTPKDALAEPAAEGRS